VVFALSVFARHLLGMHLLDTGGSILATAIQHASWNAAGNLDAVRGAYEFVAATALLTLLLAFGRRVWHPELRPRGPQAEKAEAAKWISPALLPTASARPHVSA
jgi:hypothetical protein